MSFAVVSHKTLIGQPCVIIEKHIIKYPNCLQEGPNVFVKNMRLSEALKILRQTKHTDIGENVYALTYNRTKQTAYFHHLVGILISHKDSKSNTPHEHSDLYICTLL
jgi:hypothetical protein